MKLLIDLVSFEAQSPHQLQACLLDLKIRGYSPELLGRVPFEQKSRALVKRLKSQFKDTVIHFVDLHELPFKSAAEALNNFLADRFVEALIVGPGFVGFDLLFTTETWGSIPIVEWSGTGTLLPQLEKIASDAQNELQLEKPVLSIVSPYPPQKSGVADYVAQLLPALSTYYRFALVVPDEFTDIDGLCFPGEVVSASQFLDRTDLQQRVSYQIGNSPGHLYALPIMEKIPGVVTLHDFYMGDALRYQESVQKKENVLLKALLGSHGLNVLPELSEKGSPYCTSHYPCNFEVLSHATQVAVHAQHVIDLAHTFYDNIPQGMFVRIPFPKEVRETTAGDTKARLRQKYGIGQDDFVMATFGFGVPTKRHDIIIQAWMESIYASDPRAHLLIIGEYPSAEYRALMQSLCQDNAANIRFVGFVDESAYWEYLNIVDMAVQLRVNSRGETSAAVMDCLASGIPVIANDHGTLTELPEDVLWKIPDPPNVGQLMTAIEHLRANPALCTQISCNAQAYLREHHTLEASARSYYQAIESSLKKSPHSRERVLIETMRFAQPSHAQAAAMACAIAYNRPQLGKFRLLVDISEVATHDLRTGIQRVVRSILSELLLEPPGHFEVCPVYLDHAQTYRHARQFTLKQYGVNCRAYADDPVMVRAGDIYLGLDLHPTATADAKHIFAKWRNKGVRIIQVLYDLLPVQHSEWFPPIVLPEFTRWLHAIVENSDQILAISQTVAQEMDAWLDQQQILVASRPAIGWFHLGADIVASIPTVGLPDNALAILSSIAAEPSFLMVATVEPRKGHAQTLAAFEILWRQGSTANLVIVGKKGWLVDALAKKIESHPQLDRHLFWLQGISDEYLEAIYPKCAALIAASEGEGFGLPIIEAAEHHIPVIARDIAVFREVGGQGVSYFRADTPEELANYLQQWLATPSEDKPLVQHVHRQTWRDSARQVSSYLVNAGC